MVTDAGHAKGKRSGALHPVQLPNTATFPPPGHSPINFSLGQIATIPVTIEGGGPITIQTYSCATRFYA